MKKYVFTLFAGILFTFLLLPQISFAEEKVGKLQELKEKEIIPNNGVDLKIKDIEHFYRSLSGKKIEYSDKNKKKILKQKIKDLKKYNSQLFYGQKKLTLEDIGGVKIPEFTVK